jgi:hypothetical protein
MVNGGGDHLNTMQTIYIGLESVSLAEAMAVNKAIGFVRPRQKADLKFETFSSRKISPLIHFIPLHQEDA